MITFAKLYEEERRRGEYLLPRIQPGTCMTPDNRRCQLCHAPMIGYEDELRVKNLAFRRFWTTFASPGVLQPIAASPLGRRYRVVTKRKARSTRGGLILGLIDANEKALLDVQRCDIEPDRHAILYRRIGDLLRHRSAAPLVAVLQYVILKGTYERFALIFNVSELTQPTVRAANTVSKLVTREFPDVQSVFLYENPSGDRYYLGSASGSDHNAMRRLYGSRDIMLHVGDVRMVYDVQAFSQVNLSVMPVMLGKAAELLGEGGGSLFDLYSGYGLFSIGLAGRYRVVRGLEISQQAVSSAMNNAIKQQLRHVRFNHSDISPESLLRTLPMLGEDDAVILDPPRSGAAEGVIEAIADRNPGKILHVFCNTELLKQDIALWKSCGYRVQSAVPVDNFPGTDHLEVMLLLSRA